ncbi:hypothetical protein JRQ81_009941 [Phrynocephalus forsythii]|uniref:Uncharacterized protein n=1 Tax=Phrynocephalus forsythii TaxID=171643 RepID=A0A9Q1AS72_9SAUR|nr:hypothetical protein JRQ81_009941 [Phrynocephalus forsythii]
MAAAASRKGRAFLPGTFSGLDAARRVCRKWGGKARRGLPPLPEVRDGAWWIQTGWGAAAFSMRARRGSSQKGTVRRPSKKLKCEKKSPAKVDVRESAANPGLLPKVTSKRPSSGRKWPDLEMMLQRDNAKADTRDGQRKGERPKRSLPGTVHTGHRARPSQDGRPRRPPDTLSGC